ncbi:hypothetical protein [Actinocrispum wychmicini]|uniref:Methionine-rich copper-binding protein CopC n=1 Tax=Actinocrispum wychmicini TaxID=1213861 RepID=A0A4V2S4G3_9PSEU|nr:hypothetical protein [Actinocrispum wychmicini]TCO48150.1 hypothetical protein EV192_116203 [Actinocrispum wychmicini]
MRRTVLALLSALGLMLGAAAPALAYDPVNIVHTERVQVGPYGMTVGFSTWPVKAMQSLDFTFMPDDGIDGKSGYLSMSTGERSGRGQPLARHPRKRDVWGLDVRSLPSAGDWTFKFTIDGPAGQATGQLTGLKVMDQPGPPLGLSWAISTIPLFGLIALIVVAWRRTRRHAVVPA